MLTTHQAQGWVLETDEKDEAPISKSSHPSRKDRPVWWAIGCAGESLGGGGQPLPLEQETVVWHLTATSKGIVLGQVTCPFKIQCYVLPNGGGAARRCFLQAWHRGGPWYKMVCIFTFCGIIQGRLCLAWAQGHSFFQCQGKLHSC